MFFESLHQSYKYIGIEAIHHPALFDLLNFIWRSNRVPVLFPSGLSIIEKEDLIKKTGLSMFVTASAQDEAINEISKKNNDISVFSLDRIPYFTKRIQRKGDILKLHPYRRYFFACEKKISNVLFTSGSTEKKAIAHTFCNHYFSARGSSVNIPLLPGDVWMASLPIHHIGGLSIFFRTFYAQAEMVFPASPRVKDLIDAIGRSKRLTHLSLVGAQLEKLIENDAVLKKLQKVKAILLGGSAIAPKTIEKAINLGLPVYISYGSSEMSSQIATSKKLLKTQKEALHILPYREVKINKDSEILVRGRTLFSGYLRDKKVAAPVSRGGWFYTRDLGNINSEHVLTINGRKDSMFISGGENIHPELIERVLNRNDTIRKAMVVPFKNARFGESPVAFLWFSSDEYSNSQHYIIDDSNLIQKYHDQIVEHLEKYYCPLFFINANHREIVSMLEVNDSVNIKIRRSDLISAAAKLLSSYADLSS